MAHRRSDDPYAQDAYYHRSPDPAGHPPRRSISERNPARSSTDDRGSSRRHRQEDAPRGSSHRQGDGRPLRSPTSSHHYEDRRSGDSRRDPRDPRDVRAAHHSSSRHEAPRGDRHEDPHRHQRSKTAEDPGRYNRSSLDHRSSKEHPPRDDRDRDRRGGGSHTSHNSRTHGKDKHSSRDLVTTEPPRGREKHASSGGGGAAGIAAKVRSSTMPAAERAAGWWKNPAVQAKARTAFTAGAAAAMNNRGGQGDWLGAKGVKVAFAGISAALASGALDSGKKDEGGSGGRDRGRDRSSSRDRGRGRSSDRGKDKSSGRSKSEGRGGGGGDYKQKIMQSGMDYLMKKAAAGR